MKRDTASRREKGKTGEISPSEFATQRQTDCCRAQDTSVANTLSFYVLQRFGWKRQWAREPRKQLLTRKFLQLRNRVRRGLGFRHTAEEEEERGQVHTQGELKLKRFGVFLRTVLIQSSLSCNLNLKLNLRFKYSFSPRFSIKQAISNNIMFECQHRRMVHCMSLSAQFCPYWSLICPFTQSSLLLSALWNAHFVGF